MTENDELQKKQVAFDIEAESILNRLHAAILESQASTGPVSGQALICALGSLIAMTLENLSEDARGAMLDHVHNALDNQFPRRVALN